jgi:hypothetical protein
MSTLCRAAARLFDLQLQSASLKISPSQIARVVLSLAALAFLGIFLYFMHEAGCAGDLKTGTFGDLPRALAIETTGMFFAWLSIGCVVVVVNIHAGFQVFRRIATVICATVLSLAVFTYLGMDAETRGVQRCAASQ